MGIKQSKCSVNISTTAQKPGVETNGNGNVTTKKIEELEKDIVDKVTDETKGLEDTTIVSNNVSTVEDPNDESQTEDKKDKRKIKKRFSFKNMMKKKDAVKESVKSEKKEESTNEETKQTEETPVKTEENKTEEAPKKSDESEAPVKEEVIVPSTAEEVQSEVPDELPPPPPVDEVISATKELAVEESSPSKPSIPEETANNEE